MYVLAALFLLTATAQDVGSMQDVGNACPPIDYQPTPTQPNGPGLWIGGIAFSPEDIAEATQTWDSYTGQPIVILTFSETGQRKFVDAQQGRIGQVIEITLDGELLSDPVLLELIEGREIMISDSFNQAEATALAERLSSLP